MNRSQGTKVGRATQGRKTGGRAMDRSEDRNYTSQALDMLKEDHQNVKKLFGQGERLAVDPDALQPIVQQACEALTQHAEIEEEFFYPALRQAGGEDLIAEAQVEHNSAKQLIADLASMDAGDERYRATFKVLGEYVKHHIKEEEGEIFPMATRSKVDFEPLFEALSAKNGAMDEAGEDEEATGSPRDGSQRRTRNTRSDSRSGR